MSEDETRRLEALRAAVDRGRSAGIPPWQVLGGLVGVIATDSAVADASISLIDYMVEHEVNATRRSHASD